MEKTLFLGNGINLLETENKVSWKGILNDLAQKVGGHSLLEMQEDKPFTLIYETLCLNFIQKNNIKQDLSFKQYISNLMLRMTPNNFHTKFLELGVKNIITTNYDYSFEKTNCIQYCRHDLKSESRYSAYRRTKVGNTYIWHIHGEIELSRSIMLGYEHYGGYLQKIRKYVLPSQSQKEGKEKNIANLKRIFDREQTNSWVDLFLRDDVSILGFSLDYSEIDIWWLLVFKSQCKARYGIDPGKTIYYHWTDKKVNNRDEAKLQLLKALGVDVHSKYEVTSFCSCYDEFLEGFGSYNQRKNSSHPEAE